MKGKEILRELGRNRGPERCFIRWWGKTGASEFELVQTFRDNVSPEQDFEGFELLDLEQMWDTLEQMFPESVSRENHPSGGLIIWRHDSGAGEMVVEECPFSPESIMMIYDIETRGRVVH